MILPVLLRAVAVEQSWTDVVLDTPAADVADVAD